MGKIFIERFKLTLACLFIVVAGLGVGYAVPKIPTWLKPNHVTADNSVYFLSAGKDVVLYSTSWCGYCAKTRAYLKANNVAYLDLDIEKSELAQSQYNQIGAMGVPLLLVGNRRIRGFEPKAFDDAIQALRKR